MVNNRKFKLDWFMNAFNAAKKKNVNLSKKVLVAMFCNETAATTRTALEIIKNFEYGKVIKIEDDLIIVR